MPDRRARVARGRLLVDRDRRREPLDRVDVGLLHQPEELAGVGGKRLDVAPLPLGVDRVEGEARLARAREPGDDDQRITRQLNVHILEVVLPSTRDDDPIRSRHRGRFYAHEQMFPHPSPPEMSHFPPVCDGKCDIKTRRGENSPRCRPYIRYAAGSTTSRGTGEIGDSPARHRLAAPADGVGLFRGRGGARGPIRATPPAASRRLWSRSPRHLKARQVSRRGPRLWRGGHDQPWVRSLGMGAQPHMAANSGGYGPFPRSQSCRDPNPSLDDPRG